MEDEAKKKPLNLVTSRSWVTFGKVQVVTNVDKWTPPDAGEMERAIALHRC